MSSVIWLQLETRSEELPFLYVLKIEITYDSREI